jgi:hypothetical protein
MIQPGDTASPAPFGGVLIPNAAAAAPTVVRFPIWNANACAAPPTGTWKVIEL